MNAADVVAQLESRFTCAQGLHRAQCQTNEVYVNIGFEDWSRKRHGLEYRDALGFYVHGVVREMAPRRLYETEKDAAAAILATLEAMGELRTKALLTYLTGEAYGIAFRTAERVLQHMAQTGKIQRKRRGFYSLPSAPLVAGV